MSAAGANASSGDRDGAAPSLRPCPTKPNCVSSRATDAKHYIDPLRYTGHTPGAIEALRRIIGDAPRAAVVDDRPGYLRAEFTSRLFRFVDDLELLADEAAGVIHVRSASRIGYSDLGANRRRVEWLRKNFSSQGGSAGD